MSADADERPFRLLVALVNGGIPVTEANSLIAGESGNPAWKDATRRLQEGASMADCIPGLPPPLKPILRWAEQSGRFDEEFVHIRDFWRRPEDRRVPLHYLARATQSWELREALRRAPEFSALHPQWADLAAATDIVAALRSSTALFPAPLGEALVEALPQDLLPKVFAALGRGCESGLIAFDGRSDRPSSIRHGLFSLSLLLYCGVTMQRTLAATVPAILDEATRNQFALLSPETIGEEPMKFLSAPAMAVVRQAFRRGDVPEMFEYVATHLVDG